ncbi:7-cyano-7-deazaguanine synthase QueC [Rickettsiales endosymbiont of Peranema trichophorum]|uniref:7-cyano-7-deazaguanine synthase QueC n=1 Tax=Rickettsiales endosymbiont of Peranema trichophorum TaxID=2486577 RepID=UPI001022F121|nr:7-cyano-7-deazaguanine synthase QueC [Rickettsiales endosymbiont of Peranema trichophorum]RZI45991.1 7-cyano-7-deazaguanine synthase QueC [Rickettsiales endosymbiont of Peranema trichophorum]
MKKAVVLFSSGLDSSTVLAIANSEGYQLHCLTFDYGQRHSVEIEIAKKAISKLKFSVHHKIARIDLRVFGGSALTDDIAVPKNCIDDEFQTIPVTYVPARNMIFLSYAIGYAETVGASDVFIGVNQIDYSQYPDCRAEFVEAFQTCANLGTKAGSDGAKFIIHAPLQFMHKRDIIKLGLSLGVDYSNTITCYDPVDDISCGICQACHLRLEAFKAAGIPDPIRYVQA